MDRVGAGRASSAEYLQMPVGLIEAVAYYGEYRDEIDAEIKLKPLPET